MRPQYLQELIKSLQEFYKCPSCATNYYFDDIRFLGEVEAHCFVQLTCHGCSLPVLAFVSMAEQPDQTRIGNDLPRKQAKKFAAKGEISADEIAEFHRVMSSSKSFFNSPS